MQEEVLSEHDVDHASTTVGTLPVSHQEARKVVAVSSILEAEAREEAAVSGHLR